LHVRRVGRQGYGPKAALAQLGDTRDGTTTGIELFASENETTFDVATCRLPSRCRTAGSEGPMSISK